MFELLQRIFIGHNHKWVEKQKLLIRNQNDAIPDNIMYILECEHCGKLKKFSVY